jgi:hypothetical protein
VDVRSYTFDNVTLGAPTVRALDVMSAVNVTALRTYWEADVPPIVRPDTVTGFATPTPLLAKAPVAVPVTVTESPATTPVSAGVPVTVAVVVPLYSREDAANPVTVSGLGDTMSERSTGLAARYVELPDCEARITTVPAPVRVNVDPETFAGPLTTE